MIRANRAVATAIATVLVVVGGASCSSGDDGGSATSTTKARTSTTGVPATETTADLAGMAADRETVTDEVATAAHTITFTKENRFEPDLLELPVGEVVTFQLGEGADIATFSFDGTILYTLAPGTPASFTFAQPNNQTATEVASTSTVTISVTK